MEIDPINPIPSSSMATVMPDVKLIEEFNRTLFGQPAATPEANLIANVQTKMQQLEQPLSITPGTDNALTMNPEQMLSMQAAMVNKVLYIDLTAKVAGSASQSINKLVTMQ